MTQEETSSQHGCAIVLDDRGLLVLGPSGSGKSRICHLLVKRWNQQDRYAHWVADDRFILQSVGGVLIAHSPSSIAGLAERRFHGIEDVDSQAKVVVDFVVQLVEDENLERLPDSNLNWQTPCGSQLPLISVPSRRLELAIELVEAYLRENRSEEATQKS